MQVVHCTTWRLLLQDNPKFQRRVIGFLRRKPVSAIIGFASLILYRLTIFQGDQLWMYQFASGRTCLHSGTCEKLVLFSSLARMHEHRSEFGDFKERISRSFSMRSCHCGREENISRGYQIGREQSSKKKSKS